MDIQEMKKIRKELGWSQQHFAELAGLSIGSIQKWESGKTTPHPHHFAILQQVIKKGLPEKSSKN